MALVEYYQRMCLRLKMTLACALIFIERDSFVENVRTITLSQPIPTTWDVSNVIATRVKFIAAAFLPLTFFYITVIMLRISVTSSKLNAFVMISQIIANPAMIRRFYSSNLVTDPYYVSYVAQFSVDFIIAIFAIWNLDFFRSLYGPICLHPDLKYQQVLS